MTHVQVRRFWSIEPLDYSTVRAGFAKILREMEIDWIQTPYAPDFPEIVSDIERLPAVPPAWHQDLHGDFKPHGLVIWSNILGTDISIDGLLRPNDTKDLRTGQPIERTLQQRLSETYLTVSPGAINVIDNVSVYHRGPSQTQFTVNAQQKAFKRAFCRAWLTDECADRILNV